MKDSTIKYKIFAFLFATAAAFSISLMAMVLQGTTFGF